MITIIFNKISKIEFDYNQLCFLSIYNIDSKKKLTPN